MEGYIGHNFYLKNVCTDFYQNSFRSTFYTATLIALEYCLIPKSRLLIVNMGSLKTFAGISSYPFRQDRNIYRFLFFHLNVTNCVFYL